MLKKYIKLISLAIIVLSLYEYIQTSQDLEHAILSHEEIAELFSSVRPSMAHDLRKDRKFIFRDEKEDRALCIQRALNREKELKALHQDPSQPKSSITMSQEALTVATGLSLTYPEDCDPAYLDSPLDFSVASLSEEKRIQKIKKIFNKEVSIEKLLYQGSDSFDCDDEQPGADNMIQLSIHNDNKKNSESFMSELTIGSQSTQTSRNSAKYPSEKIYVCNIEEGFVDKV